MDEPLRSAVGDLIAATEAGAAELTIATATLARLRAGLELLGQGHIFDAPAFARALLAGQEPHSAHEADLAESVRPRSAEEQVTVAEGLRRVELRREITQAALKLEAEHEAALHSGLYRDWHQAEQRLYTLAREFRAAGGDEVTG